MKFDIFPPRLYAYVILSRDEKVRQAARFVGAQFHWAIGRFLRRETVIAQRSCAPKGPYAAVRNPGNDAYLSLTGSPAATSVTASHTAATR
jgi:hypothetical protein